MTLQELEARASANQLRSHANHLQTQRERTLAAPVIHLKVLCLVQNRGSTAEPQPKSRNTPIDHPREVARLTVFCTRHIFVFANCWGNCGVVAVYPDPLIPYLTSSPYTTTSQVRKERRWRGSAPFFCRHDHILRGNFQLQDAVSLCWAVDDHNVPLAHNGPKNQSRRYRGTEVTYSHGVSPVRRKLT